MPTHGAVALAVTVLATAWLPGSVAFADAGRFESVSGEVSILRADGRTVPATPGAGLNEGDSIRTGADGRAHLRMLDDARLEVRRNTLLKLDAYRFEPSDNSSGRSLIGLLRGAFRSITGAIGRANKEHYRIVTPSATIGIRGTDHESGFVPPGDPGFPGIDPGTYNLVIDGSTFLEAHNQRLELGTDESGFAGLDPKQAPIRLREAPAFLRSEIASGRQANGAAKNLESDDRRDRNRSRDRARDHDRRNSSDRRERDD